MLGSPLCMILGLIDFISIFQNKGKREKTIQEMYIGGGGVLVSIILGYLCTRFVTAWGLLDLFFSRGERKEKQGGCVIWFF